MGLIVVGGGAGGQAEAEVIAFEFGVAEKRRRLTGRYLFALPKGNEEFGI